MKEVDEMKTEAEKYNNPEGFSKYGKLRRQLMKKEKELPKLKEIADQSKLAPAKVEKEEKKEEDDGNELLVEEATNVADDPPLVPDQPQVDIQ